jgi:hypothetical protein
MSWTEFIRHLSSIDLPVTEPIWRMSDGQSFRQAIPILAGEDDRQTIGMGAGYKLYEVSGMEFIPEPVSDQQIRPAASIQAQLDAIEQAARISGLIYRRKPNRIIIRAPYTC